MGGTVLGRFNVLWIGTIGAAVQSFLFLEQRIYRVKDFPFYIIVIVGKTYKNYYKNY